MNEPAAILRRKHEHLDLALRQNAARPESLFDSFRLEPCALPELALDDVDLSTQFLSFELKAPLLISSMTGGPRRGAEINARLAEAAAALGIGLAVGSQRVALEGAGSAGIDDTLRRIAPDIMLLANLGGAQLIQPGGVADARRAVEMIQADGLIVHLNALQEAVQLAGDTDWRSVLAAIAELVRTLGCPVVVKEVGYGISGDVARRLRNVGVAAIDVAGCGGTAWALIEAERAGSAAEAAVGKAFADWGIPTPLAILDVRRACPDMPLIASGGARDGVDAAKALRLGADLVGQAGGVLQAALTSTDAVIAHFEVLIRQLRIACFCTGARDLAALRQVRLLPDALPLHDL